MISHMLGVTESIYDDAADDKYCPKWIFGQGLPTRGERRGQYLIKIWINNAYKISEILSSLVIFITTVSCPQRIKWINFEDVEKFMVVI